MTPLYPQKLALTSPTGGGRSVGIVRSRTKATEFYHLPGDAEGWHKNIRTPGHQVEFDAGKLEVYVYILLLLLLLLTAIGLSPGGSGYFTCIQNMKLVTTKFKSGELHEKHVVTT